MNKVILSIVLAVSSLLSVHGQSNSLSEIGQRIRNVLKDKDATVGIAVIFDNGDTLTLNNQHHYPLMSVCKFPLTIKVLDYLEKYNLPLATEIIVGKKDLLSSTYSPLRDAYPEGGTFTIAELIKYTIAESDNNTCDVLFRYVGGTEAVQQYVDSLDILDMKIVATEEKMGEDKVNEYLNWSTPYAATQLLERYLSKRLFAPVYQEFLESTMIETVTGLDKIRGLLPSEAIVGHKTGSSSRDASGRRIGDNDLAFVRLPNGRGYSIAVFVTQSLENDKVNASIIAEISKIIYDYYKSLSEKSGPSESLITT